MQTSKPDDSDYVQNKEVAKNVDVDVEMEKKEDGDKAIVTKGEQAITNIPKEVGLGLVENMNTNGIVPEIQNVVATANLGVALELKSIAMKARNAEYNPKRFAAVIMRVRVPKTTALIFSSGKIVVTGAKHEGDSKLATKKYAKIIHKLGYSEARLLEFRVQNIVASCDVRFPVRLESLWNEHSDYCSYEPELFPGLIFRMLVPKIVLLIFVSGKVVLTGAKVREEIYDAFKNIYHVLCMYRKT